MLVLQCVCVGGMLLRAGSSCARGHAGITDHFWVSLQRPYDDLVVEEETVFPFVSSGFLGMNRSTFPAERLGGDGEHSSHAEMVNAAIVR